MDRKLGRLQMFWSKLYKVAKKSAMAFQFHEARKKRPKIDQQTEYVFALFGRPRILGLSETKGGSNGFSKPRWCEEYAAKKITKGFRKWNDQDCSASSAVTYDESLKNVDGVICACNGTKVIVRPQTFASPDYQSVSVVRAESTEQKYKAYAFQLRAPTSQSRPSSSGLQYHFEFEHEAGNKKDGLHNVTRRHVKMEFNRIIEFMDNEGTGLRDELTHHIDPSTSQEVPGIPCDSGNTTSASNPGKSCVLQDFFLDRFDTAQFSDTASGKVVSLATDLQGTAPWCDRSVGKCKTPPSKKPTLRFEILFEEKKVPGGPPDFGHTKMNIYISSFPYKNAASKLALRAKYYTVDFAPTLTAADQTDKEDPTDQIDCTKQPLPSGCPDFLVDHHVKVSWSKFIGDSANATKKFKVLATTPSAKGIPLAGKPDRLGTTLPVNNMYFSFKHGSSIGLKWDPTFSMKNLVETMHSSATTTNPVSVALLTLFTVILLGILQS